MTTRTKVILGIVGAAAAGVVVGLLLAPDKGSETRKRVGETAGGWVDSLSDLFSSAKDEVGNLVSKGSKTASDAGNKFNNVTESFS